MGCIRVGNHAMSALQEATISVKVSYHGAQQHGLPTAGGKRPARCTDCGPDEPQTVRHTRLEDVAAMMGGKPKVSTTVLGIMQR